MQIKIPNTSAGGKDTNLEIPYTEEFKCSTPGSEETGHRSNENEHNAIHVRLCWS